MVKRLLAICLLSLSTSIFSQSIQLGLGAEGYLNNIIFDKQGRSKSQVQDPYISQDTSRNPLTEYNFYFENGSAPFTWRIPIFMRYTMKNGLWFQLDYSTEKIAYRFNGNGNFSEGWLVESVQLWLDELWWDYNAFGWNENNISYEQFRDLYIEDIEDKERQFWNEPFSYKETTTLNNLGINIGYTFLRTKKIRPFISAGFTWASKKHKFHQQSLSFNSSYFSDYNEVLNEMPTINENMYLVDLKLGVEIHKIRFGISGRTTIGNIQSQSPDPSRYSSENVYKMMYSFGGFMHYSLFDFNLREAGDRKKLKDDELKVLGDFQEKKKLVKLSIGVDLPLYTNINSYYEQTNAIYGEELILTTDNGDQLSFTENLLIMHQRDVIEPNSSNTAMENNYYLEIAALGEIKKINQFPGLSFNIELEPVKWFSWETKLGYQFNEFQIEGKLYRQYDNFYNEWDTTLNDYFITWNEGASFQYMTYLVQRESFHNVSLGQRFNFKFDIVPGFQIGFSGGAKANLFLSGKFRIEPEDYNSWEIQRDFDQYWNRGENSDKWYSINDFDPNLYYDEYNLVTFDKPVYDVDGDLDFENTFVDVPESEKMSNFTNRFNFTWMAGIDFYFERLRFNIYGEGAITDINFLYRDFFTVGLGIHYYLRK